MQMEPGYWPSCEVENEVLFATIKNVKFKWVTEHHGEYGSEVDFWAEIAEGELHINE